MVRSKMCRFNKQLKDTARAKQPRLADAAAQSSAAVQQHEMLQRPWFVSALCSIQVSFKKGRPVCRRCNRPLAGDLMHMMHHSCSKPAQLPTAELRALARPGGGAPRCVLCGVLLPTSGGGSGELHACHGLAVCSFTVDLSALPPFACSPRSDCAFVGGADLRRCRPGHVIVARTVPGAAAPSRLHVWVGQSKMDLPEAQGLGVFAVIEVPEAGWWLMQYTGVTHGAAEASTPADDGLVGSYAIRVGKGEPLATLDAARVGGVVFLVNHACSACNCECMGRFKKRGRKPVGREVLWLVSTGPIAAGTELRHNYRAVTSNPSDLAFTCSCPDCGGAKSLFRRL
ncbi:MAG: hypothetical protein J3K34DRAFT_520683 [Monoraphidium minutum]|nr:MAG: hypothetical protein J3K34DRAFT_520683 [Monoraphidium minutum]